MIEKTETRTVDVEIAEQDTTKADYRRPELRSAGRAAKLIQGVGEYNSYDQCGHASWGC